MKIVWKLFAAVSAVIVGFVIIVKFVRGCSCAEAVSYMESSCCVCCSGKEEPAAGEESEEVNLGEETVEAPVDDADTVKKTNRKKTAKSE